MLRKTAASRSFTDLRKAASDALQVPNGGRSLHRTRSQDMMFSASSSSGHISKTSEDQFEDPEHRVITPEVEAYFANEKLGSKQRIEEQKTKEQALHDAAYEKKALGHSRLEDTLGTQY